MRTPIKRDMYSFGHGVSRRDGPERITDARDYFHANIFDENKALPVMVKPTAVACLVCRLCRAVLPHRCVSVLFALSKNRLPFPDSFADPETGTDETTNIIIIYIARVGAERTPAS